MSDSLERVLEAKLRLAVRRDLLGMFVKMVPIEKGMPDRMVILPGGQIHLIELKTTTGKVSPRQAKWHADAADRGVSVTVLAGTAQIDKWVRERREWLRHNV